MPTKVRVGSVVAKSVDANVHVKYASRLWRGIAFWGGGPQRTIHFSRSFIWFALLTHFASAVGLYKARIVPMFIFCNLGICGDSAPVFPATKQENLRYKKRCTFGFISLEHLPHGNLRF